MFKKWFQQKPHTKSSQFGPLIARQACGQPIWTPRNYAALGQEGYEKNVIVFRCINLIAKSAASVPWRVYAGKHDQPHHPVLSLLHQPNPRQGGAAFIEAVIAYKLLAGNSYIELVADQQSYPRELYPLRPDRMKVVPGPHGLPAAYEYTINGQIRKISVNPVSGIGNILHLKTFHPLNDWYGMSPIEAAAMAIDQHNAVSSHNLALLQNGGRPSGALKINTGESPLTLSQRQQLREDLQAAYQGGTNAGRILVLEGDCQWQEMGLSPKDLDFATGKHLSAREIAQAYGVPPMLVGVPGDATYANYKEARLHLWEETIMPLLDHLCDEFNHWLMPRYGSNLSLQFHLEAIPALAQRREQTWQKIMNANFLTLNEKRQALGYAPIAGGDRLPMNGA